MNEKLEFAITKRQNTKHKTLFYSEQDQSNFQEQDLVEGGNLPDDSTDDEDDDNDGDDNNKEEAIEDEIVTDDSSKWMEWIMDRGKQLVVFYYIELILYLHNAIA